MNSHVPAAFSDVRPVGFSTGAVSLSDFGQALEILATHPVSAVELSALRTSELGPLTRRVASLDLARYAYVSVHAPSRFTAGEEACVAGELRALAERGWPVVLHPDTIHDFGCWREFGARLCIENMDKRKPRGRNVAELNWIFERLPEARLCFDIAHARQYDSSMTEAYCILRRFGDRLQQVHISEVNTRSGHDRISPYAVRAFQQVAWLIPDYVPIIIESPVDANGITAEMELALRALTPATASRASA